MANHPISSFAAMGISHLLRTEACIYLRQGRQQEAFEDTIALLRFVRGHGGSRQVFLIEVVSQRIAVQAALWPIWEACRDGKWNADQWLALEGELSRIHLLETCSDALWMETLLRNQSIELTRFNGDVVSGVYSQTLLRWRGFRQLNKVRCLENTRRWLDVIQASGSPRFLTLLDRAEEKERAEVRGSPLDPSIWFSQVFLSPNSGPGIRWFTTWQSYIVLARVACVLERWRLTQGSYPATLEALGGEVVGRLPRDPVNGELPHYRLREDGQYELYTVGLDGRDDGGRMAVQSSKTGEWQGDIVWPLPRPAENSQ